jgi:ferrous iron transport protein B
MAASERRRLTAVLLGNPNTGKSTLFTSLAGIPTRIGNYPGVTVERKLGRFTHAGVEVELVDLPGTYSLDPKSPDERVAVEAVEGGIAEIGMPDCVVAVVDSTNLERNLFLVTQAIERRLPVIVALTLSDIAVRQGIEIDAATLSERLGCPVVPVASPRGEGLSSLKDRIVACREMPPPHPVRLEAQREAVDARHAPAVREATARYAWIGQLLDGVVARRNTGGSARGRIDAFVTHRVSGTVIFAATMLAIFTSIFVLAAPLMDLISAGIDAVGGLLESSLPDGAIKSLLVDGVVAGVGGVVVFLPQIAMLFLFVALLEDCGYLARAAYLMDRLLAGVGLGGKSFIPLLSCFACAIPGIMATRTIENRRERLLTILVAPLMSCSARLPVYLLFCGAFVPNVAVGVSWLRLPAVVLAAMYAVGVVAAAAVAFVLSRTFLRGRPQPFVMELPPWRLPQPGVVLERVREACWSFLSNAGTTILAVSIVIWALGSYPKPRTVDDAAAIIAAAVDDAAAEERGDRRDPAEAEAATRGEALRQSFLGMAGRAIEPVVKPLGWDWRIGCAAIASFPAREVVLGTLGVIYNLGDVDPGEEEGASMLVRRLRAATWDGTDRRVFTLPVAISIMVFFALCAQCASTLVVIGRETSSWVWPAVTFVYMTALAWLAACATFQIGSRLLGS